MFFLELFAIAFIRSLTEFNNTSSDLRQQNRGKQKMFFNLSSFRGIFSIFIACICVNFCKEFVRADATGQGSSTSREHPTAQKGGTNGKKAQASAPNSQTADDSPTPADEGIFDYREGSLDFGSNMFVSLKLNLYKFMIALSILKELLSALTTFTFYEC